MTARAEKRPAQGLDPMPSLAELRRMYETRTGKALEEPAVITRFPAPASVRAEMTNDALGAMVTIDTRPFDRIVATVGDVLKASRCGDTLRLTLNFAPRTKKNGGTGSSFGMRQKRAYRLYRDAIINAFRPVIAKLGLPLPKRPYNIRVTYFVDRPGEQADKCGLDQGLYDALENAAVVDRDYWFRQDDGTRIVFGAEQPRVEVHITPLDGAA